MLRAVSASRPCRELACEPRMLRAVRDMMLRRACLCCECVATRLCCESSVLQVRLCCERACAASHPGAASPPVLRATPVLRASLCCAARLCWLLRAEPPVVHAVHATSHPVHSDLSTRLSVRAASSPVLRTTSAVSRPHGHYCEPPMRQGQMPSAARQCCQLSCSCCLSQQPRPRSQRHQPSQRLLLAAPGGNISHAAPA